MSEYHGDNGHCWECDGAKFVFALFLITGIFIAALAPLIGVGIIILGAKITNV
jgi:hypothetical protein